MRATKVAVRVGPEKMAQAEKRTNQITLKAGMTVGASAAEMDDEFLLPCVVSCPAVTPCPDVSSSVKIEIGGENRRF
jgi:hypothetical protein